MVSVLEAYICRLQVRAFLNSLQVAFANVTRVDGLMMERDGDARRCPYLDNRQPMVLPEILHT